MRRVVITGAGTGIGLASAIRLGEAGAKLVICGRTVEKLETAKVEIEAAGGEVHTYACDLSDLDSCDQFMAQVLADHGRVDILINGDRVDALAIIVHKEFAQTRGRRSRLCI